MSCPSSRQTESQSPNASTDVTSPGRADPFEGCYEHNRNNNTFPVGRLGVYLDHLELLNSYSYEPVFAERAA